MLEHATMEHCLALLYTARTGSHLCKSALMSHPEVREFHLEGTMSPRIWNGDEIVEPSPRFTGFKLASMFLIDEGRLGEIACPKIATYRNNKLSQYISLSLAKRDHRWQDWPYFDKKIHIPVRECGWYIKSILKTEKVVRETWGDEVLWVEYGELVTGSCFEMMQKHLGLPVVELKPFHRKQSRKPLIEYVENIDELLNSPLAGWI